MKRHPSTILTAAAAFAVCLCGPALRAQTRAADPGWPRVYSNGVAELTVYNPQIEGWSNFKQLKGRCAFALRPAAIGHESIYGTFRFDGDTLVDADRKLVLIRNIRAADMRFPSAPGETSAQWLELTRQLLPAMQW